MTIAIIVLAAILAAVLTSFIGAFIDRKQEGKTLLDPPRSQCVCGEDLKPHQLIPIFYPLFAKFRAPCGAKIPYRYPLGELIAAIVVANGTYMILDGGIIFGIVNIFFGMFVPAMIVLAHHQKQR